MLPMSSVCQNGVAYQPPGRAAAVVAALVVVGPARLVARRPVVLVLTDLHARGLRELRALPLRHGHVGTGVEAEPLPHDAGGGDALDGGAPGRGVLAGGVGLGEQRAGGGVALARVGEGLAGRRVVAGREQLHVAAEPAVQRLDVGAQVVELRWRASGPYGGTSAGRSRRSPTAPSPSRASSPPPPPPEPPAACRTSRPAACVDLADEVAHQPVTPRRVEAAPSCGARQRRPASTPGRPRVAALGRRRRLVADHQDDGVGSPIALRVDASVVRLPPAVGRRADTAAT
jgi:hypothetical protein